MTHEYVRVCPVCDAENQPTAARCACGALLTGVDFSLKPAPIETPAVMPAPPPVETAPSSATEPAAALVCPHADCAQPNPPGQTRCIYCNRPLAAARPEPLSGARLSPDAPADNRPPSPDASTGSRSPPEAFTGARPPLPDASTGARSLPDASAGHRPLPAALRNDYRVIEAFPVSSSEADILLVEDLRSRERRVAKLYRRGLEPDFRLLTILSQTVGDTVVHVLAHGVSEGVAYELLEYVPGGTLEDLLRAGPLARDDVRRIVAEIADALNGIHAHRILHRDLKPENVLVRSKAPLELALTDFGIASLSDATQHFTSVARTTMYAAPEVLTGVIDLKSDWWSLGMIALEAAAGRHPFAGLTEQVMNHHLATRPIDVRGIYDDELRALCQGLLLRDPKRRWGAGEVARWIERDPTLEAPHETGGTAVRAYRIGSTECTTSRELAPALARHWPEARKDLARGQIASWIEHELHDYNLVRKLRDVQDHRDLSDDARLLRFLLAAAPDLPPVWLGLPVSDAAIVETARRAASGEADAEAWLDTLYRENVLTQFMDAAHADLREVDRCWRESWAHFLELWNSARAAEEAWRKKPRGVAGFAMAEVVSYDDVMYGALLRMSPPEQPGVNASLLLAQVDPDYVSALRGEVASGLGEVTGYCPWYEAMWERAQDDPVGVLVMHRLLRHARDDAAQEKRRAGVTHEARARIIGEARDRLSVSVGALLQIAPEDRVSDDETVTDLLDALPPFQDACQNALRLGYSEPDCEALRASAERFSAVAEMLHRALTRCEKVRGLNAIFIRPERLLIAGVAVLLVVAIRSPWTGVVIVLAAVLWIAYRLQMSYRATRLAESRIRALRAQAKTFNGEGEEHE